MSWQLVRLADVQPSAWRNGGGMTRELAAWPAPGDWRWRMSVADIGSSGPFSRFDGVQRWFAVLGGAGVELTVNGKRQRLTAGDAPFCFDGSAATDCRLLSGKTLDFNLMVCQGLGASRMLRVSGCLVLALDAPKTIAVYAMDTGASVLFDGEKLALPAHSLCWRTVTGNATLQVNAAQALCMEIPA
jgi:uncharacterized protein